jgi:hypothetical protein
MNRFLPLLFFFLLIGGCIKPEPPNMEADIIDVHLPDSLVRAAPIITNNTVSIFVDYSKMHEGKAAPTFDLTPGATITPASGSMQDFTTPVNYTVTSEDGKWQKSYVVSLLQNAIADTFLFENWMLDDASKFYTPYENVYGEHQYVWASGNSGFALLAAEKNPAAYPTQRTTEAFEGSYAVKAETKSTGSLGAMVGMPIAAGNLFLGRFDGSKAMTAPLEATVFGVPFNKKPIRFTGAYKYKSGGNVKDRNSVEVVPLRPDECSIYAVLFKPTAALPYLNGHNVLTAENVVAIAELEDGRSTEGDGYHRFDIRFEYNTAIEPQILAAFGYKLVLVFSSSKGGATFEGAVGSTLLIDDVRIITE